MPKVKTRIKDGRSIVISLFPPRVGPRKILGKRSLPLTTRCMTGDERLEFCTTRSTLEAEFNSPSRIVCCTARGRLVFHHPYSLDP
ncbi:hypothetical protein Cob_v011562 [Colletotrichum orbiculare MAFF 240422]|uniref:Uncharacterized protein n=1 Tax=Colletotrichum orbiculare (strain 104-T / ATCC 96160 / CBS 514.97 / LARS 414 / MAFF 240422) TaxID=1213857 RepID=A0A484FBU3_COLOR|nr:hypothetical protein Cob_v011562 [Colletotrichum orbiculare MAFF 240422]